MAAPVTELFGLVIPGRMVMNQFQQISTDRFALNAEYPQGIEEITFFFLPSAAQLIPLNYGAVLYYSFPPFNSWEIIGSITPNRPSGNFRTKFTSRPELFSNNSSNDNTIQFGISLTPLTEIENLGLKNNDDRYCFAHKIAKDLHNFMCSFSNNNTGTAQDTQLVVPINIFDRWIQRFEDKYKRDPNFMMKSTD